MIFYLSIKKKIVTSQVTHDYHRIVGSAGLHVAVFDSLEVREFKCFFNNSNTYSKLELPTEL
jgi:hypothetical protein